MILLSEVAASPLKITTTTAKFAIAAIIFLELMIATLNSTTLHTAALS